MGAYAACWLDHRLVGATKNGVDPGLMDLFGASDRCVVANRCAAVPVPLQHWAAEFSADEPLSLMYYRTCVRIARDRLEVAGYTLETAKRAFARSAQHNGEETRVEEWLDALKEDFADFEPAPSITMSEEHMGIAYAQARSWGGYPGHDPRCALRLLLEAFPETQELIYDVTDLLLQGYVTVDEPPHAEPSEFPPPVYATHGRTVVLTEGKSDGWILKESLQLLYPHLADAFAFMDFEGFRVGGGAGVLANLVKAFAGAGILNKTIALFDNDTAGRAALASLKSLPLPVNIRVLTLPSCRFLGSYPTIGPTGARYMDVNGVAASIELYLGRDALTGPDGALRSVQWGGYDRGSGQYQGEVTGKSEIHGAFQGKIERARNDPRLVDSQDWEGMRVIIGALFSAFHETDALEIIAWDVFEPAY